MSSADPTSPAGAASSVGSVEDLHAAASKATGLTDFGPDDYTDGLTVLLESCARDAGLTPPGAKAMRAMLRGALTARLCSEAAWQANPGSAQVRIDRPVFVTGLPRTGTTALHRLLAADPAHQGLAMWLAEVPQPRPPLHTWRANPVFRYIQAACERFRAERARHNSAQFFDVSYDDLAADPVGTAEAAYAYFGLPFGGAVADAMRGYLTRGRSRSAHRYALADFGLTAADVDARFGTLSHSTAELR